MLVAANLFLLLQITTVHMEGDMSSIQMGINKGKRKN